MVNRQNVQKIKKVIDSADSFLLFTYKEGVGSNFFNDYNKHGDYYALMHFVKLFVKFHQKKEIEEGEAFFNNTMSDDNDGCNYFG
mgnify:CR=1 FL=1